MTKIKLLSQTSRWWSQEGFLHHESAKHSSFLQFSFGAAGGPKQNALHLFFLLDPHLGYFPTDLSLRSRIKMPERFANRGLPKNQSATQSWSTSYSTLWSFMAKTNTNNHDLQHSFPWGFDWGDSHQMLWRNSGSSKENNFRIQSLSVPDDMMHLTESFFTPFGLRDSTQVCESPRLLRTSKPNIFKSLSLCSSIPLLINTYLLRHYKNPTTWTVSALFLNSLCLQQVLPFAISFNILRFLTPPPFRNFCIETNNWW